MEKLKRLKSEALDLVTESFRKGESELSQEVKNQTEKTEIEFDKELLREKIDEIISKYEPGETKMDEELAPVVHEAIKFENRRQAADPEIWNYLSIVFGDDYVRHRWEDSKSYFISKRSLKRHGFGRLWWLAEITSTETCEYDEETLEKLMQKTDLIVSLFERKFSDYNKVVKPFIEELGDDQELWRNGSKELNKRLSTYVLEDLSEEEIRDMIKDIREEVKG